MIRDCDSCGGPIEGSAYAAQWTCTYCGRTVFKTAVQRPAKARTPVRAPVAMRPAFPRTAGPPRRAPVSKVGLAVLLFWGASVLVGFGSFLVSMGPELFETGTRPNPVMVDGQRVAGAPGVWSGREPLRCGAGDRVQGRSFEASFPTDLALEIGPGCEVMLDHVQIEAPRAVRMTGGSLTLSGSTLRTTSDGVVVEGRGPNSIRIQEGSSILSGSAALRVEGSAEVLCTGSTLQGSPEAIRFLQGGGAVQGEGCREIDRP